MNTFRRDPVTGQIVIIAAERDSRPNQFLAASSPRLRAPKPNVAKDTNRSACQFCADQMQTPPITARYGGQEDGDSWQVCVVPNLYPSLNLPPSNSSMSSSEMNSLGPFAKTNQLFQSVSANGFHEVIIESPTHETLAGDLSEATFKHMLVAYQERTTSMYQQGARYVQVIKNSGEDAGASVRHTHSQVFGIPFVPEHVALEVTNAASFFDKTNECVFCQILAQEQATTDSKTSASRIVATSENFVAWCPFASRVAYELHIAPRDHAARFEETGASLLDELAVFLRTLIRKLDQHPRIHAFNYLIHSLPPEFEHTGSYHWHLEVLPRIAKEAGFEWGTGVHINTVTPEQAAKELRGDALRESL